MTTITLEKTVSLKKNRFIDFFDLYKYIIENNIIDKTRLYDFEIDFKELPKKAVSSEMKQLIKKAQKKDKSLLSQIVYEKN